MTTHNRQITNVFCRLLTMMRFLLIGLVALVALEQMVEPAFAAQTTEITAVHLATGHGAAVAANEAVSQQTAASTEKVGAKVSIANFTFVPAEITIAPGESVTWTNDDGAPHGLEYADGAQGTNLLLPGASFSRQFDQPGTYDYSCAVHPYMTGRVIVRAQ